MTSIVSPAQRLTVDVQRLVIKHVVNEMKMPFGGVSSDKHKLKALLSVCHSWREVALEYLWNKAKLRLNANSNRVRLTRPPWIKENVLSRHTANMVKELHVGVHLSGIVSGTAYKCLVEYLEETKFYPSAYKLVVTVTYFKSEPSDESVTNVLDFAELLKSMAPAAKTIEVVCVTKSVNRNIFVNHVEELDEDNFGLFAKSLCSGSVCVNMDLGEVRLLQPSTIDCIPQLSRLTLCCFSSQTMSIGLVHKSAMTLQYLHIKIDNPSLLFHDVDNDDVVYPNLQHLHISHSIRNNIFAMPVSATIVPLPILRSLIIDLEYTFDNDILFRGNSTTLEYLKIGIDKHVEKLCNKSRIFENKHKALRHVILRRDYGDDDLHLISKDDMNRLLNNLVSNTQRLVVSSITWLEYVIVAAQHGQGFQNIRIFQTENKDITFLNIMSILKALPAITRIRSNISGMDHRLAHITANKLPDHIVSTYGDAGSKLEVWEMTSFDIRFETEAIDYILLLALVCPNLYRVEVLPKSVPDYHEKIMEALKSSPYTKYASQLSQVLNIIYE